MRYFSRLGIIVAVLAIMTVMAVGAAGADEVWRTDDGQDIVYDSDIDGTGMAVLKFGGVTLYVEGLAGIFKGRSAYSGVWFADNMETQDPDTGCSVAMVRPGASGEASRFWGQLEMTFIDADFPSIWLGQFGECFGPLTDQVIARPVIAGNDR